MSSPAEVAHEAAAFLIQEAFPAVGCLHPALARGPPVLPKERHGTELRTRPTGRMDPGWPRGCAALERCWGNSDGDWDKCRELVWRTAGLGWARGSLDSQRAQALGRVSYLVGLREC